MPAKGLIGGDLDAVHRAVNEFFRVLAALKTKCSDGVAGGTDLSPNARDVFKAGFGVDGRSAVHPTIGF